MRLYYRILRFLCQIGFVLIWRGRVFGQSNVPEKGGVLLVSNHQSFLDPVLITLALHREGNYMARDTLFKNPYFRVLIESLNAFPVRRATADVGAIKEIIRRLREGRVVVAFPEGTRTEDGLIRPLHEGALLVAKRAGCAIVPVVIEGAFEAWPRDRKMPLPAPISVAYGRVIPAEQIEVLTIEELTREVSQNLQSLQVQLRGMRRHDRAFHERTNQTRKTRGIGDNSFVYRQKNDP